MRTGRFPPVRASFRPAAALRKKRFLSTGREVCALSGISAGAGALSAGRRISAIPASAMTFAGERPTPGRRTRSLARPGTVQKTSAACAGMLLSLSIGGL
jgi:hypothetical protein